MGMSAAKKARLRDQREGKLNPEISRGQWHRKPHTHVKSNLKAQQRRSFCRKPGISEGAVYLYMA